jgi:hypothetical protein
MRPNAMAFLLLFLGAAMICSNTAVAEKPLVTMSMDEFWNSTGKYSVELALKKDLTFNPATRVLTLVPQIMYGNNTDWWYPENIQNFVFKNASFRIEVENNTSTFEFKTAPSRIDGSDGIHVVLPKMAGMNEINVEINQGYVVSARNNYDTSDLVSIIGNEQLTNSVWWWYDDGFTPLPPEKAYHFQMIGDNETTSVTTEG